MPAVALTPPPFRWTMILVSDALLARTPAFLLLATSAVAACGGGRARVGADEGTGVGIRYEGTTGYVGHPMRAEIESDEEVCPRPWVATVRGVEGDLPAGLSLTLPDGDIEGTPRETGAWRLRVLLDDLVCGDHAPGSVALPVTITIEEFQPEPPTGAIEPRSAPPTPETPTDDDGDGVTEDLDRCPRTASGIVVDDEGCPKDSDGDYVPDGLDECPDTPRGTFVDVDGCPIPSR